MNVSMVQVRQAVVAAFVAIGISACATMPVVEQPTEPPATSAPATNISTVLPATSVPTVLPATNVPTALPATSVPVTNVPTALPSTSVPTVLATSTLSADVLVRLPTTVYFIDNQSGQITSLEIDGTTVHQITHETERINSYTLSPVDNRLAYDIGDAGSDDHAIIVIDENGQNREELATGPVSNPLFSPSGDIAFDTTAPVQGWEIGKDTSMPGVWLSIGGGRPSRIIENDPAPDPNNPPAGARTFRGLAWSPDGKSMLLQMAPNTGNGPAGDFSGTGIAVRHLGGALVEIAKLGQQPRACLEATWSQDNAFVLCTNSVRMPNSPALWRADAQTGAAEELIPSEYNGADVLVTRVRQGLGSNYLLLQSENSNPNTQESQFTLRVFNLDSHKIETLNTTSLDYGTATSAMWGPDKSGVVVMSYGEEPQLRWVPSNGAAPLILPVHGYLAHWRW